MANIGVLCDTTTALDVDPRHGGDDTLHELQAEHGELPATPTVITHSKGSHYYFDHVPDLKNAVSFAPGLDIRTKAPGNKVGFVIGVGSINTGGRYEWDAGAQIGDVPKAEMPPWLIEVVKAGQHKNGRRSRGADFSSTNGTQIRDGSRDDSITSGSGRLKWEGKSRVEVFEQMKRVRDARVEGGAYGFTDEQVKAKVDSVFAYEDDDSLKPIPGAPDFFKMNSKGVWYLPPRGKGKNAEEPEWTRICSRLEISAFSRSKDSEDWGRLAQFKDADGGSHEWPIPMDFLAADGKELRARLQYLGLWISTAPTARYALLMYINLCQSGTRVRAVAGAGWYQDEFVFPENGNRELS